MNGYGNNGRMRRLRLGLCCALACALLAGCRSGGGETEQAEPGELPYDQPVMMRVAYSYTDIELPEGDMGDNNFMLRYVKDKTGVIIKYDWEAGGEEQYNNMLDLAIRSNDLPDAFIVNREQFRTLAERDALADLTDIYPRYASSLVRSIYDATDGKALKEATIDGKLYGLPNVAIEADAPTYLWIRQDWLDKLSLPVPRTLNDIALTVKAFMENDPDGNGQPDTMGIPVDKSLVFSQKQTGLYGLDSVFAAYKAFPKSWIRSEEGHVVYGSIQPEAKRALALLAEWYRSGVIDKEFMLRKDVSYEVSDNKAGLFFGPWWAPYFPLNDSVSKDTKAEWRVYAVPLDEDGKFVTRTAPVTDHYIVVRKDYPHPEAALKVLNLMTRLERNAAPDDDHTAEIRAKAQQIGIQLRNYYPFNLLLDYPDAVVMRHDLLKQTVNGEITPDKLDPDTRMLYNNLLRETENPRKDMEAWSTTQAYMLGGAVSKTEMVRKESLFYGSTPAIREFGERLQRLEQETYLKIITGELPVDAFDAFVEEWLDGGGTTIMREVSESIEEREKSPSN